MELYEDRNDQRDKFEILAFHDKSAQDFPQLDKELKKVKEQNWNGHDLPFPILLDSTGETIKTWGVQGFPTTVLIDPDGNLVGEAEASVLEAKLPPLSPEAVAKRTARALDRQTSMGLQDSSLGDAISLLSRVGRIPIEFQPQALQQAKLEKNVTALVHMSGSLSLRSWLELTLSPFPLAYEVSPEGIKIVFSNNENRGTPSESRTQVGCAKRLREVLAKPISFDFQDKTLQQIASLCEELTGESFVVDPRARHAGAVTAEQRLSGFAKDEPLGAALNRLLKPAGLTFEIKYELVLLTPAGAPAPKVESPTKKGS